MSKGSRTNIKLAPISDKTSNSKSRQNIVLETTVLDAFRPHRPSVAQPIPLTWRAVNQKQPRTLRQPRPKLARSSGKEMEFATPTARTLHEHVKSPIPQPGPATKSRIMLDLTTPSPPPSTKNTSPHCPPTPRPATRQTLAMAHLRSITPEEVRFILRREAASSPERWTIPKARGTRATKVTKVTAPTRELRPRNRKGKAVTMATNFRFTRNLVGKGTQDSPLVID
ncbi:hypothetical protein ONS95_010591 [Cadophora gregata]|uniref:uncharacterized protein n=1 Tax=Cadophora gregata TaxID=51156 RepID=UPI0026DA898D|nr:uncharacterized protein ONS95_010591 [Cadophora gregata]KAK0122350.1 hypothetical protein ONS95_010591 [Cadophora gregata]KAK0127827.1 hypothetical protein ONS96_007330 [Cadophora gregata f. sp. sojae]